jgi:hypothetical protein
VLVILETMPGALASLRTLLAELNQGLAHGDDDWCFDWVKGSILNDPPGSAADLTWGGGPAAPRHEGYAVFFRANRAGAFNMVPAFVDMSEGAWRPGRWNPLNGEAHFVELSRKGRLFDYINDGHWTSGGAYNPATDALLSLDAHGATVNPWPDSEYPYVNFGHFAEPHVTQSRRPAFILADLHNGGLTAARLCPIMGFHAPSNLVRAQMGTYISGLAREPYVVHDLLANGHQDPGAFVHNAQFVAGGDYNVDSRNLPQHPDNYYGILTNAYSNALTGGADATSLLPLDGTGAKTTVQIKEPMYGHYGGDPIEDPNVGAYLSRSIDQAFYRGLAENNGGVYNFMQAIMNVAPQPYRDVIRAYGPFFDGIIRNTRQAPDRHLGPIRGIFPEYRFQFTNWADFYRDIKRGRFTTARSAAEFLHIFISDHLPLVLYFSW